MDIRATNPVFIIANLLNYGAQYYATCFILPPKLKKRYVMLIWTVFYGFFSIISPMFQEDYSTARDAILIVGIVSLYLLLFEGKWYVKMLCFPLHFVLMLIVELAFMALFETDNGILDVPTPKLILRYCEYFLVEGLLEAAAVLLIRKKIANTRTVLTFWDYVLFSLYPLSLIQLMTALCNIMGKDTGFVITGAYTLLLSLLEIFSVAGMLIIIYRVIKSARLRAEQAYIQQQLDLQQEYYSGLAAYYRELRRQRHDLANHLLAVGILISEDKIQDATSYLNKLERETAVEPQKEGVEI